MSKQTTELIYFDIPYWKGEIPRILFYLSNKEFKDTRISKEEFNAMKITGELQFGQVPILIENNRVLTQGCAIMKYLAYDANMLPTDSYNLAKVDEILYLLEEFQILILATSYKLPDLKKRKEDQNLIATKTIPEFFTRCEKLLNFKLYFVCDELTLADLCVWKVLHWITTGEVEGVSTDCLHNFKILKKFFENINSDQRIMKYKAKYPKFYLKSI